MFNLGDIVQVVQESNPTNLWQVELTSLSGVDSIRYCQLTPGEFRAQFDLPDVTPTITPITVDLIQGKFKISSDLMSQTLMAYMWKCSLGPKYFIVVRDRGYVVYNNKYFYESTAFEKMVRDL